MLFRRLCAASALLLSSVMIGLHGSPAHAQTPPPGLSIAVTNGRNSVVPHSDETYAVTVRNAGSDPVTLWVVGVVPRYATITAAAGGKATGHTVTWKVSVAGGRSATRTVGVHVGAIPAGTYRVTVVADVYLGADTSGAPLIGSADSDRIPGVAEPTRSPSGTPTESHTGDRTSMWQLAAVVGGAIVVAATAAIAGACVRRRSRTSR